MANVPFPLAFKRQFSGPLDEDLVFETEADLNAYLSSALRHAGQIVGCAETETIYILSADRTRWIPAGSGGAAGPSIIAAVDLSGHRVIAANGDGEGVYADHTASTALPIQGVSTNAALAGDVCFLARDGTLDYPPADFTPGLPVFLGSNGLMTQTPPATGWLRQVGFAVDADTLSLDIGPVYWLGA